MSDRRLNIVVWGINYWPEQTGIAPFNRGLCRFLRTQGHQVSMITGFAYYPAWSKAPADRRRLYRTDQVDGLPVYRCWQYVPRRATTLGRIIHELSFGLTSFFRALARPRADLYLVISPPLLLGPLAWLLSRLKRSRFVFHVQDLQPDAALALGMMKPGAMTRVLTQAARFSYHQAGMVSGISRSMIEVFTRNGVPAERQYLFPNWVAVEPPANRAADRAPHLEKDSNPSTTRNHADPEFETEAGEAMMRAALQAMRSRQEWRRRHRIPDDAFVASYSGNLGKKQGLEILVDAARRLEQERPLTPPVCIVIAGDGAARPALESRMRNAPPASLRLLPLLSDDDYLSLLATSDVCLITQAKGTGRFCFPSKLLSTLVASRPVAAVADDTSELAHAVRDGGFGVLVPPEDPAAVADALTRLAARPVDLEEFARNGRRWVTRFEDRVVLEQFEARLRQLVPAE